MAFCMSKNSSSTIKKVGLYDTPQELKKIGKNQPAPVRKSTIISSPQMRPGSNFSSSILNKETNPSTVSPMSNKKGFIIPKGSMIAQTKGYFNIKTSVSQTRFSMKDIKDLMEQFNKHSNWVLVDGKGDNVHDNNILTDVAQTLQTVGDDSTSPNTANTVQNKRKSLLKGTYKKVPVSSEEEEDMEQLGVHYIKKMSKKQFRSCMGLLGLDSNAFLSDRIFEVVDYDKDDQINFVQFATIMDTFLNGNENEKHEFSFALFDVHNAGYFDFEEFKEIITKFIAHFCIITGSHSKVDSESLREIFEKMDTNKDEIVDVEDYKAALKENPGLFNWFELLNQLGQNDGKRAKKVMLEFKQKTATDILQLQKKLETLMNQMHHIEEQKNNHQINDETSSKQSSQLSYYDSNLTSHGVRHGESFKSNSNTTARPQFGHGLSYSGPGIQGDGKYRNPPSRDQYLKAKKSMEAKHSFDMIQNRHFYDFNDASFVQNVNQTSDFGATIKDNKQEIVNQLTFNPLGTAANQQQLDAYLSETANVTLQTKLNPLFKHLLDRQLRQDVSKHLKKQVGEKRIVSQQTLCKKGATVSDEDENVQPCDEDDDEQDKRHQLIGNRFHRTATAIGNQRSGETSRERAKRLREQFYMKQQAKLAQTAQGGTLKLNVIATEPFVIDEDVMRHGGSFKSQMHQQQSHQKGKKKKKIYKSNKNHESRGYQGGGNGYTSDISPHLTVDGTRSDFTTAQGGAPTPGAVTNVTGYDKSQRPPLSGRGHLKNKSQEGGKHRRNVSQISQGPNSAELQQVQILKQMDELKHITFDLLQKLQDDPDKQIKEQVKDYIEAQKIKMEEDELDNELERASDIMIGQDSGALRPLNQIQSFVQTRSKKRVAEALNKKHMVGHIHKAQEEAKNGGSQIHIGHDNWNLVLHMMLGIRQSVRNVMHEEVFELIDADFQRKYVYELVSKKTLDMRLFTFLDFSPRVFHLIRNMFGISPDEYLKSIGPENLIGNLLMGNIQSLQEQSSTGKSGSFFYYTSDQNFMLKTISCEEFHRLRDILKDYYEHLVTYPHSLITRFFGLHKIKYNKSIGGKVRIYFVIMANVFKTARDIHVRYDLKGSKQGRRTKKSPEDCVESCVALKDLDFTEAHEKISVEWDIQKALVQQIEDDVRLFQKLNINDYSLLLGIHRLSDKKEANQIKKVSPNIHHILKNSFKFKDSESQQRAKGPIGQRASVLYNTQEILRPPIPFYESHDGGILSADGKVIYFIGIIDTLTYYGAKKKLEYTLKSLRYGNTTISCIPPQYYGERFIQFMKGIFESPAHQIDSLVEHPPFTSPGNNTALIQDTSSSNHQQRLSSQGIISSKQFNNLPTNDNKDEENEEEEMAKHSNQLQQRLYQQQRYEDSSQSQSANSDEEDDDDEDDDNQ